MRIIYVIMILIKSFTKIKILEKIKILIPNNVSYDVTYVDHLEYNIAK